MGRGPDPPLKIKIRGLKIRLAAPSLPSHGRATDLATRPPLAMFASVAYLTVPEIGHVLARLDRPTPTAFEAKPLISLRLGLLHRG